LVHNIVEGVDEGFVEFSDHRKGIPAPSKPKDGSSSSSSSYSTSSKDATRVGLTEIAMAGTAEMPARGKFSMFFRS